MSFKDIYSIYMSFTSNLDIYMLLNSTWCLKYTCIPWLYCRNGMRDPEMIGLVVWSGKEGPGVETIEPWKSRAVSQNGSYGLDELLCKFVEMDTNTFKSISNTLNCYYWGSEQSQEKFALMKLMRVRWIQNFIWHLVDACGRTKWSCPTWPTRLWSSILRRTKDSSSAWCRRTMGVSVTSGTRWTRQNWNIWLPWYWWLSSGSQRRREDSSKTAPSKNGLLQGLWHWGQFTGKSVVIPTPASKWGMSVR